MRFTEEELAQIYDYVAERLITARVLQPKLLPTSTEEIKAPKLGERINVVIKPNEPKALSESMSENINVPSASVIRSHTVDWTQGGKSVK